MKQHLMCAHNYWKNRVRPGDLVIDATVGNGQDTLFLATLLKGEGVLIGYDIQQEALNQAQLHLYNLPTHERQNIILKCQSHAEFEEQKAHLIVYNLGYLPGGDKKITTRVETTVQSIKKALLIAEAISITCYPGHEEGRREQSALLDLVQALPSNQWNACFHQWLNRPLSPTLLWLQAVPDA